MGGEGSISGMITSYKNNRKSLRSKRGSFRDNFDDQTLSKQKIRKVKVSPSRLELIKKQIRKEKRKERRIQFIVFWSTMLLITSVIFIYLNTL